MMRNKRITALLLSLLTVLALLIGCDSDAPGSAVAPEKALTQTVETAEIKEESEREDTKEDSPTPSATKASTAFVTEGVGQGKYIPLDLSQIPPYSGTAYAVVQGGIPNFSPEEVKTVGYESYSPLDAYGRTVGAIASVGKDTMPKAGEKRGSISSIHPSAWVQARYEHISGKYLYNRCHLIGWQLSAENANKKNLITGTKYLNNTGMLPFENMVADYIKETGNHVAYRITPIYEGENLLASGVEMEAWSVEDKGEGISFHVYCYNVQPGVQLNYATGSSHLRNPAPSTTTARPTTTTAPIPAPVAPQSQTVYITRSGKRYHSTTACRGLSNANAIFEASLTEATGKGLTPCSICY